MQSNYYFGDDNETWLNNLANNATYGYDYDINTEYDNATEFDLFPDMPQFLKDYDKLHFSIHGYLALFVIVMGTLGNTISIVVLTRKNMINSINAILCALAVADIGILLTYLTKIKYHSKLYITFHTNVTYTLAVLCLFVKNSFTLFHTVSLWLTVVVAIWRVMAACYSLSTKHFRSLTRAKIAIASTYISCAIVCIPEYIRKEIIIEKDIAGYTYKSHYTQIYLANQELFENFDDYGFNLIIHLIPCISLAGFIATLIIKLRWKRKKLEMRTSEQDQGNDGVTRMLIVIFLFSLFANAPKRVMYTLTYVFGYNWVDQLHWTLIGTINILILLNSSVIFIVYIAMSSQFRTSINAVFWKSITKKVQSIRLKSNQNQNYSIKKIFKKEMRSNQTQINELKDENV